MTKKSSSKKKDAENKNNSNRLHPPDLDALKRKDLQKLCKAFHLKANGKNVELIESLRAHYNQLELKEINHETKTEDPGVEDVDNSGEEVDVAPNKGQLEECNENVIESPEKPETTSVSNTSSPKDWNWIARWCVVDGVLKQDAAERWVVLSLIGGRTVIVDDKTKEKFDFVLEPTILPTPETCDDNYICGDCARRNKENLSGWLGIKKAASVETPKSSLGKENINRDLLKQSFKRKREEVLSPQSMSDFGHLVDSPMKVRRLNPRSCSPASPKVRRERGEDFQLPKNLQKPCRLPKKKISPPREDPDFAQKVEKIISNLSPDAQQELVFGRKKNKNSVLHSPPRTRSHSHSEQL